MSDSVESSNHNTPTPYAEDTVPGPPGTTLKDTSKDSSAPVGGPVAATDTDILRALDTPTGSVIVNDQFFQWHTRTLIDVSTLPEVALTPPEQERHQIYCHLLAAITAYYWCGNKYGRDGSYPLNTLPSAWDQKTFQALRESHPYLASEYAGHNIAALAVDGNGEIIDFDFNHNNLFDSTIEHAEARLVRRVYNLSRLYDTWNVNPATAATTDAHTPGFQMSSPGSSSRTFQNVTIYTSLESCAQCSGIMALGTVKQVVYLQPDPTMYRIGNILRNLTKGSGLDAPLPIPASSVGYGAFDKLNEAYFELYEAGHAGREEALFFVPADSSRKKQYMTSITSFLSSKYALEIFQDSLRSLRESEEWLANPTYSPDQDGHALSNAECLEHCKRFYGYAVSRGKRGTPHHA